MPRTSWEKTATLFLSMAEQCLVERAAPVQAPLGANDCLFAGIEGILILFLIEVVVLRVLVAQILVSWSSPAFASWSFGSHMAYAVLSSKVWSCKFSF